MKASFVTKMFYWISVIIPHVYSVRTTYTLPTIFCSQNEIRTKCQSCLQISGNDRWNSVSPAEFFDISITQNYLGNLHKKEDYSKRCSAHWYISLLECSATFYSFRVGLRLCWVWYRGFVWHGNSLLWNGLNYPHVLVRARDSLYISLSLHKTDNVFTVFSLNYVRKYFDFSSL